MCVALSSGAGHRRTMRRTGVDSPGSHVPLPARSLATRHIKHQGPSIVLAELPTSLPTVPCNM